MITIEISDEVFKYLNSRAIGFDMNTPDKVLKTLLCVSSKTDELPNDTQPRILSHWGGVAFYEGMTMRIKARPHETAVVNGGRIIYKDESYKSPSGAAVAANNGISTNGWIYWEYLDSSGDWKLIDFLRKK